MYLCVFDAAVEHGNSGSAGGLQGPQAWHLVCSVLAGGPGRSSILAPPSLYCSGSLNDVYLLQRIELFVYKARLPLYFYALNMEENTYILI